MTWDVDHHTTTNTYDAADDLVQTVDPRGAITTHTYNAYGDETSQRRQLNATEWAQTTWDFGTDTHGRAASMSQAITATQTALTIYSSYGDFTEAGMETQVGVALSATDTVGRCLVTRRTLDGFGQQVDQTDPVGVRISQTTYDLAGRVVSETDATGTVTHHRYDVLGNEVETSRTAGAAWADWTSKTVDPTGLVLLQESYITSGGVRSTASSTTHLYDGSGVEITAVASNVGTSSTAYDVQGNATAQWSPGVSTADTSTAQTSASDADGRVTSDAAPIQLYTPSGDQSVASSAAVSQYATGTDEVATYTPPTQAPTIYQYDAAGNQTTATVPLPGGGTTATVNVYDLAGRLTSATDASGNVTITSYDLAGHVLSTTLAGAGRSTTTTYNKVGWVLSATDPAGVATRFSYDADGRAVDEAQSVLGAQDAVTHHVFDPLGRDVSTLNPDGSSVQTTYDLLGRVTRRIENAGGSAVHDVRSLYDEIGRVVETSDTVQALVTDYAYATSSSGITTVTQCSPNTTLTITSTAAGLETGRSLEVAGAASPLKTVVAIRNKANQQVRVSRVGLMYWKTWRDSNGRISGEDQPAWIGAKYTYDPASGLKLTDYTPRGLGPSIATTYTYTADGRLASTVTNLTSSGVSNQTTTGYAFDAAGNLTAAGPMALHYDAAGELTSSTAGGQTTTYSYDARGRRVSQASQTASATFTWDPSADRLLGYAHYTGGVRDVSGNFAYDASGQRLRSVVTSGSITTTTSYTYQGTQLLKLISACGTQTTELNYIYDELDRPLMMSASVSGDPTVYQVLTSLSDRGDILSLGTSAIAHPFRAWSYDAYGNITSEASVATTMPENVAVAVTAAQPLRYAGYAYDSFSGLYYCSQRYYDPATMQWISRDPAKADGEESAYQYCGGNPVARSDATGTDYKSEFPTKPTLSTTAQRIPVIIRAVYYLLDHSKGHYRTYWDAGLPFAMIAREAGSALDNTLNGAAKGLMQLDYPAFRKHADKNTGHYYNTPRSIYENIWDGMRALKSYYKPLKGKTLEECGVHAAWHYNGGPKPYVVYAGPKGNNGDSQYLGHLADQLKPNGLVHRLAGHGFPQLEAALRSAQKRVTAGTYDR